MRPGGTTKMKTHQFFSRVSTGAVVLGIALCVPAAMLAQDTGTAPPPQVTTNQQPSPGQQPMRHRNPPSAHRQLRHLTRMLNLTQDQQRKMLPILQDQHKRMEALRHDQYLDRQQRRAQMRDAMMETHQKLEVLMTDTQKQQFEQAMQQRRERMRSGVMGPGDGRGILPPPPGGQSAPVPSPR